jgi:hypothetical protein
MGAKKPQNAAYKRSWKNYLINARYQLRFSGVLVAMCALLMIVLGWWMDDVGRGAKWVTQRGFWPSGPAVLQVKGEWPSIMSESANSTKVGESSLKGAILDWEDPANDDVLRNREIAKLNGKHRNLALMLGAAVFALCAGLFVFGITMTHKVAGPLYKVGLYLDKVRGGKYDKVYPLRKGDQLVEFFDHFREAHLALRHAQERDVEELKALIAAAEKQGEFAQSKELTGLLGEMREILKKKEAGLV